MDSSLSSSSAQLEGTKLKQALESGCRVLSSLRGWEAHYTVTRFNRYILVAERMSELVLFMFLLPFASLLCGSGSYDDPADKREGYTGLGEKPELFAPKMSRTSSGRSGGDGEGGGGACGGGGGD
ncbi:hypothetical protein R1flu_011331 [Riccia fluitans]|uniref:Glycine-rich protein n=1 Tax=Riccia fluitans TaxID=41844 RepID=A0ABD1ZA07_9MARC